MLFCTSVNAQDPETNTFHFGLDECIQYAFEHQYAIRTAEADVDIAQSQIRETIGQGLPQISGTVQFQDYVKLPVTLLPGAIAGEPDQEFIPVTFGTQYDLSLGVEAEQLLFDGSYLVGLQASKVYKELSTKNLQRSKIETAVEVAKAYYTALVTEERLELTDANLERIGEQLDETRKMYESGMAEEIDADRLQVEYNNAVTEKKNLVRMANMNVLLLKFQMGMPVTAELTLKESIDDIKFEPAVLNEVVQPEDRIEYSTLLTQERLNELDLKRYKSEFLPKLSAFGSYTRQGQDNKGAALFNGDAFFFSTGVIGLRLTVPLISGGQKFQKVRQANLELLKTQYEMENMRNSISLEVRQSTVDYINSVESMENQERNMELADKVSNVARIKYSEGVGSSLEVTTAETSLKEAQTNYINALYDALISKIELQRAKGELNYE